MARSTDAALKSDSSTIEKKVYLKEAETGDSVPPQGYEDGKDSFTDAFVDYYDRGDLRDRIVYEGEEGEGDRTKIHVRIVRAYVLTGCYPTQLKFSPEASIVEWSYWESSTNQWVQNTKFGDKQRALGALEYYYSPNPNHYFSTYYNMGATC